MTAKDGIDTLQPVATPEGIDLSLRPAGPVKRGLAWILDSLIRLGIMIALSFALTPFGSIGVAALLIAWFLINWWYPVLFEVLWDGTTPGKRSVGLKVVHQTATPIGWSASIVRNLLRQVDFLPMLYATGLISMLCNRRFQRLGDLAAGTMVIYNTEKPLGSKALPVGPAEPPPLPLSIGEQQSIVSFAERSQRLNPQRAAELAEILCPATGKRGDKATAQVLAWARWIHGQPES